MLVDIDELIPHPRNYRSHPPDQLVHIMQSIRENGVYRNVVVSKDNVILAGHGVVEALKLLGETQVPVHYIDIESTDDRAIKILVSDNTITHFGENDDRLLSELLKEIKDSSAEALLGTGFDDMMLANLVMTTRPAEEIETFDAAAEWVGLPEYEVKEKTHRVIVQFETVQDKEDFAQRLGADISLERITVSTWWPPREREDTQSLEYLYEQSS